MIIKQIKFIAGTLSLLLVILFLISMIADFRADMYSIGGSDGVRSKNNQNDTSANQTSATNQKSTASQESTNNNTQPQTQVSSASTVTGSNTNNRSDGSSVTGGSFINPLTGLMAVNNISRNRPVAISVSNQRDALPTNAVNGISQADIVYEMLVEGGGTRFLAIFQDFSAVGVVGSIRSARHYTVELAEAYDALFIHAGGSPLGYEEIEARGITNFDEVSGKRALVFSRNVNRIPGHTVQNYHSVTTSGASFMQRLPSYALRLTHSERFQQALNFTNNPIPSGSKAQKVTARFSSAKNSIFTYDKNKNIYSMSQYGSQFRDANNNNAVTFTNLLILETPVTDLVGHGEGAGRQDMSTVGRGTGYFISNGRYIKINWFRADKSSQFIYTDENGNALELGRGKTYIGIVPTGNQTSFN